MLEGLGGNEIASAPLKPLFGYPGGKSRSVKNILPHIPDSQVYVEAFGGSAALLLAKPKSTLEVYNDKYAGVVAFYRCMRDKKLSERLADWLEMTVHSSEEWFYCHETWKDETDPVERAARWYYMTVYSFAQIGRNFGRSTKAPNAMSGKIRNKLDKFSLIHDRFKRVQIENMDAISLLDSFDGPDTVFYLDPPYVDSASGAYKHEMREDQHRELLDKIFSLEGYVAVSGYDNPIYGNQAWDDRISWDVSVSLEAGSAKAPGKEYLNGTDGKKSKAEEILWIKEFR